MIKILRTSLNLMHTQKTWGNNRWLDFRPNQQQPTNQQSTNQESTNQESTTTKLWTADVNGIQIIHECDLIRDKYIVLEKNWHPEMFCMKIINTELIIHTLYLSESCPDIKDPNSTPTNNKETVSGAFQSLSQTSFHWRKKRGLAF